MILEKDEYFDENSPIENQLYLSLKDLLICPYCQELIKNPFMCSKCQKNYCKKCLEEYSNMKKCPNDNKESEFKHSIMINEMLSKLKYKCKNCKKEIIQSDIKSHLEEKCKYVEFEHEKSLSEIIQTKKELIKLSPQEMENKKVDNSFTSKLRFFQIKIILKNIVITLGDSGVGKTSLLQR